MAYRRLNACRAAPPELVYGGTSQCVLGVLPGGTHRLRRPSAEICDSIDNDCDVVDDTPSAWARSAASTSLLHARRHRL
jgi:hypothetical protein